MNTRNESKSYIVREGMTMDSLVEKLAGQQGWSVSVPDFWQAALGYDIV